MAQSYHHQEPKGHIYLTVVDGVPDDAQLESYIRLVAPEDLRLPYLEELRGKYNFMEFCFSLKPSLLAHLLNHYREEAIVFLDADTLVLRRLHELKAALESASIVLTPYLLDPIPLDGQMPRELDVLNWGVYNTGCIAVRRCPEAEAFLGWWQSRLRNFCFMCPERGLFGDQRWIDLVPSLFPSALVLRDDTYHVGHWNLHSRELDRRNGKFLINGRPLAFFHFSGFDPMDRRTVTRGCQQTRIIARPGTPLADLLEYYGDLLLANGYRQPDSAKQRFYNRVANKGLRVLQSQVGRLLQKLWRIESWLGRHGPGR